LLSFYFLILSRVDWVSDVSVKLSHLHTVWILYISKKSRNYNDYRSQNEVLLMLVIVMELCLLHTESSND